MEITKADIESALICLRKEALNKGALFNIRYFLLKHKLSNAFKLVLRDIGIYTKKDGWDQPTKVDDELVKLVWVNYKHYCDDYVKLQYQRKDKRRAKEVGDIITKYNIDKKDIYVSVNTFTERVPKPILEKGIVVGNGIFIINIIHFEKYRNATR